MVDRNDPSAPLTEARQPRLRAILNGQPVSTCVSFSTTSNNHFQADEFEADFTITPDQDIAFWGGSDTFLVELQADAGRGGASGFVTQIIGEIDEVLIDGYHLTCQIKGRDLSRRLRDAKTQETFLNRTSSEVATVLAQRHQLTPVVTPTSTLVSRYFAEEHDNITGDQFTRQITEWDLLIDLAQKEGFDLFVTGQELHFQPAADLSGSAFVVRLDRSGAYLVANVMQPRLSRSLTLARDIEVWVRSWSADKKGGFTKRSGRGSSSSSTKKSAQRVVVTRGNLTETAAQHLADSIRADLTRHERLLSFELAGDTDFSARWTVRLEGTGSSWDQVYYVASVARSISVDGGFGMTVQCKNHSPANESIPL